MRLTIDPAKCVTYKAVGHTVYRSNGSVHSVHETSAKADAAAYSLMVARRLMIEGFAS